MTPLRNQIALAQSYAQQIVLGRSPEQARRTLGKKFPQATPEQVSEAIAAAQAGALVSANLAQLIAQGRSDARLSDALLGIEPPSSLVSVRVRIDFDAKVAPTVQNPLGQLHRDVYITLPWTATVGELAREVYRYIQENAARSGPDRTWSFTARGMTFYEIIP